MSSTQCKECRAENLFVVDEKEGNIVCTGCGLVQALRIIDDTSEWRNLTEEDGSKGSDPRRVGMPNNELLVGKGLCTVISGDPSRVGLSMWNQRAILTGIDRTLSTGFHEIDDICHTLNLSDTVAEDAKKTFKIVTTKKTSPCKSHMGLIASCVFLSCRKYGNPIPIKEIASLYSLNKKDIQRSYCMIKQIIPDIVSTQTEIAYVKKIANDLNLPQMLVNKCAVVAQRIKDSGIMEGKNPLSLASVVVYMMSILEGEDAFSFSEISKSSGVTTNTIRNCYKQIYPDRVKLLIGVINDWEIQKLPKL
ncbi:unnamed protein product [Blepharisma stoltei]|uniref:General transcription factor TFIIB n=1 Tax=Blepharisma stoltei TaxID=1481888 RepID=A0AAU9IZE2_9CILI|nr:unnamed protein product [Blepharisma stoltei]